MAEEAEKKEEGTKAEEKKEEEKPKKQNWFSKTWNKMKTDISDSNRESKIESAYKKEAGVKELTAYTGLSSFSAKTLYGKLDVEGSKAVVFGELSDEEVPFSSVLSTNPENPDKELPKRFYIVGKKPVDLSVTIEETDPNDDKKTVNNTYVRKGTELELDPAVEEVEVIKVKETYYRKKKAK